MKLATKELVKATSTVYPKLSEPVSMISASCCDWNCRGTSLLISSPCLIVADYSSTTSLGSLILMTKVSPMCEFVDTNCGFSKSSLTRMKLSTNSSTHQEKIGSSVTSSSTSIYRKTSTVGSRRPSCMTAPVWTQGYFSASSLGRPYRSS